MPSIIHDCVLYLFTELRFLDWLLTDKIVFIKSLSFFTYRSLSWWQKYIFLPLCFLFFISLIAPLQKNSCFHSSTIAEKRTIWKRSKEKKDANLTNWGVRMIIATTYNVTFAFNVEPIFLVLQSKVVNIFSWENKDWAVVVNICHSQCYWILK